MRADMPTLPQTLYRAAQLRELDRIAIEEYGIPGSTLMERAGEAALVALRARWSQVSHIVVVCGLGNNAGDGFVLARLAHIEGLQVAVLQVGEAQRLRGDALAAKQKLLAAGITVQSFTEQALHGAELIVDALIAIGLNGMVQGEWRQAIEAMNASQLPIYALDIPSGLHADTGRILGVAVNAQLTISFIGLKQGLFSAAGPACCGTVVFNDLGIATEIYTRIAPSAQRISRAGLPKLKSRTLGSHKGDYGRVLVIGGEYGMAGAIRLAGEAAARVGAGRVSIATRGAHVPGIIAGRPELLCYGVEGARELEPLLHAATVVAIGPGLGRGAWASELLATVLDTGLPLVVDADALYLLAVEPIRRDNWVLTPHPGEAARLLGISTAEVQADRFSAVQQLQRRYGGVIVLKGAGTLVLAGTEPISLCSAGNPAMASAGMGDVLTGVITGLIAQGLEPGPAARLGVCVHAEAGDRAAQAGARGTLAADLFLYLRRLVNFS